MQMESLNRYAILLAIGLLSSLDVVAWPDTLGSDAEHLFHSTAIGAQERQPFGRILWVSFDQDRNLCYGGAIRGYPCVGSDWTGPVELPPRMFGYDVTAVRSYAFENCPDVTEILIPEEIREIDKDAFIGCENVRIVIGSQTTPCERHGETCRFVTVKPQKDTPGEERVYCRDCMKRLETVSVPALGYEYNSAFCTNMLENTFLTYRIVDGEASVRGTYIDKPAIRSDYAGRFEIPSVIRHDGHDYPVTSLYNMCFCSCTNLTEVVVPASVRSIGYYVFDMAPALKRITFLGDAPEVGVNPFGNSTATLFSRYGTDGWGSVPGAWQGMAVDWADPPEPIDLTDRRGSPGTEVGYWSFDNGSSEEYYEASDLGLVQDDGYAEFGLRWRDYPYDRDLGPGYLLVDTTGNARFPFDADLRSDAVEMDFLAQFRPTDEPPDIAAVTPTAQEGRMVVRIEGLSVLVPGRFAIFAYEVDPDDQRDVRLAVVSDRLYVTDVVIPTTVDEWWNVEAEWRTLSLRMDGDGVAVTCEGQVAACDGVMKFPYADPNASSLVNGISVRGTGFMDEVRIRRAQDKVIVDIPRSLPWGPEPSVPEVRVVDPFRGLLTEGVDYECSITDNTALGTARVTVTGKGLYTGTLERTFEVVRERIRLPETRTGLCGWRGTREVPFVYDGMPAEFSFFVSDEITESDVEITGTTNAVNAGSYKATAKGELRRIVPGEYSDTVYVTEVDETLDWQITSRPITGEGIEVVLSGPTNLWATGLAVSPPSVRSVYDSGLGRALVISDWTSSAPGRYQPGSYTITVTGRGNYSGTRRIGWSLLDPSGTTSVGGVDVPNSWLKAKAVPVDGGLVAALCGLTGKTDAGGRPLAVWEDYVMGTDPMNPDSKFRTFIRIVDGRPVVSYDPDLGAERKYTVLGSADLKTWCEVDPTNPGETRYFKVSVEMPE